MKKSFSALTVGIIAFLMLATGVAASSYYHWAGSVDFNDSMNTMDKIQVGIGLLKGDLEREEESHLGTQTELENTKAELDNLRKQLKLEDGEDSKKALENLIAERDNLQTKINTIALETSKHVVNLNNTNGAGPKYKYLVNNVNSQLEHLYAMGGIQASDILNTSPGNSGRDTELQIKEKQLEQAIKDMKEVEVKSGETLDKFGGSMKNRIDEKLKEEEQKNSQ